MKHLYFLILMIVLSACATTTNNAYIYVDNDFKPKEKTEIEKGINEFNYVLNNNKTLEIVYGNAEENCLNCYRIIKTNFPSFENDRVLLGLSDSIGGNTVWLDVDNINRLEFSIKGVLLHELGHLFGCVHMDNTLMDSNYGEVPNQCVDEKTKLQLEKFNKWKLRESCSKK